MEPVLERDSRTSTGTTVVRRLGPCLGGGREFFGNRYVYVVFSPRAAGLTVGVNLNPDRRCNFDCVYCEVNRSRPAEAPPFSAEVMAAELLEVLELFHTGQLREKLPWLTAVPAELLHLRHVALSGEGEPTLCESFSEAVQAVVHIRARGLLPFFKIVLLSNASVLDQPQVQAGLRFLIQKDELWLKLDCGSAGAFERINRPQGVSFSRVLENILTVGRRRPIIIQSLFPMLNGKEPSDADVDLYSARLSDLREGGANIALVQIYSATRPTTRSECRHLPLKALSRIAHRVRTATGLPVEVF